MICLGLCPGDRGGGGVQGRRVPVQDQEPVHPQPLDLRRRHGLSRRVRRRPYSLRGSAFLQVLCVQQQISSSLNSFLHYAYVYGAAQYSMKETGSFW